MRLVDICNEHRLDELKPSIVRGMKNLDKKSHDYISAFLTQHGFEKLGSGAYSSVWGTHDSNNVVKVSYAGDSCWLEFAEFASKNKNKHLPKISRVMAYAGPQVETTNFYCFMEKLQSLDDIPKIPENAPLFAYLEVINRIRLISGPDIPKVYGSEWSKKTAQDTEDATIQIAKTYSDFKSFKEIMNVLYVNKPDSCFWDLHKGNIMWRTSTKTLVITDPYS